MKWKIPALICWTPFRGLREGFRGASGRVQRGSRRDSGGFRGAWPNHTLPSLFTRINYVRPKGTRSMCQKLESIHPAWNVSLFAPWKLNPWISSFVPSLEISSSSFSTDVKQTTYIDTLGCFVFILEILHAISVGCTPISDPKLYHSSAIKGSCKGSIWKNVLGIFRES